MLSLLMAGTVVWGAQAGYKPEPGSCEEVTFQMKLPKEIGKRKNPTRLKWEDVDKILSRLREELRGRDCQFTFGALFNVKAKKDETVFFPLTNNVLRTVPESTFQGLQVFNLEGEPIGLYEGRVLHEKSGRGLVKKSYSLFSFQYKNAEGEFESVGGRLLLDEYLVKWDDIKDKTAVTTIVQ